MNRRVVGVVVSLVLAAVGTFLITNYVRNADERALEGQQAVDVLVVDEFIARGTPASALNESVSDKKVAQTLAGPGGSIASLAEVEGLVAGSDMLPGELLLAQRFVQAEELPEDVFPVPEDLVEVSFQLPAERAVGGVLKPGDRVAFVASFNPFVLDAVEPTESDLNEFINPEPGEVAPQPLSTPNTSHTIIHKALVVRVQAAREQVAAQTTAGVSTEQALPADTLTVTLAVSNPDVEKIVFTNEFGLVWLAREGPNASEEGTRIQTRGTIYR